MRILDIVNLIELDDMDTDININADIPNVTLKSTYIIV